MGTNGEACHLSSEERVQIIKASREVLDANDLKDAALLVGTGGQSARETIQLTKEAAEAGADFS
jgi:dihydrodipicolinate synthase/N-acetylneuraminate lyase